MNIIPYQHNHYNDCLEIFHSNVPDFFLEEEKEEYAEYLQAKEFPHWVVKVGDSIIGCGGIYEAKEDFKRSDFNNEVGFAWGMIHRTYHGKGFGKALAKHRINTLKTIIRKDQLY